MVELLLPHLAPGCSVMEVGGLWWSHGRVAFRAEELGATAVTEFDVMEPTPEFEGEQKRRDSRVRFVRGDAHLTTTTPAADQPGIVTTGLDAAGTHDVVWCTGLLYHSPDPHRIVRNLLSVTGHTLVLGTKTVPEIPGLPGMAVFFPALTSEDRWVWCTTSPGVTTPFDRGPLREYANWWWGMTPTAFRGLVESVTGWEVVETLHSPRGNHHDDTHLVIGRS